MSRTFRRKGYEKTQGTSWDRRGDKVAGYYTIINWYSHFYGYYYGNDDPQFRAPTNQEFNKKFWKTHGDNHRNRWHPSRAYREPRQRENRSITKQELAKWLKNPDYEPLVEANPRSCWWDWS